MNWPKKKNCPVKYPETRDFRNGYEHGFDACHDAFMQIIEGQPKLDLKEADKILTECAIKTYGHTSDVEDILLFLDKCGFFEVLNNKFSTQKGK